MVSPVSASVAPALVPVRTSSGPRISTGPAAVSWRQNCAATSSVATSTPYSRRSGTQARASTLIRNVGRSCRRFVIQDLIRHPLPLILFTVFLYPLIGREAAVDGRQSILRAFTPQEFQELVRTAINGTPATFTTDVSRFLSRQMIDIRY